MDKITTPMAVLISGVLIFIGLLILSSSLKDEYYYHIEKMSESRWLIKTNKVTGESCFTRGDTISAKIKIPEHRDNLWICNEDTAIKK
tara:strand:- start:291 stop:554 length:264 start_codon:yes stop_codon:yes gene_type:complete